MRTVLWTTSVLLLASSAVGAADNPIAIRGVFPGYMGMGGRGWGGGGWGGGWGGYHSSTWQEGIQRGRADIIRAAGLRNLMDSEAAKQYEEARSLYLDNRLKATHTYFEMRAVNRQARAAERGPRATREDMIRMAKEGAPKSLSPSEFDPLSGAIQWPAVLRGPEYEADRVGLEQIYAKRAADGFLNGDELADVRGLMSNLQAALKKNVRVYPPQSYTQAKDFLKSLSYESILPPR